MITPLLSVGQKLGLGSGRGWGTDASNRLFMKGVGPPPSPSLYYNPCKREVRVLSLSDFLSLFKVLQI